MVLELDGGESAVTSEEINNVHPAIVRVISIPGVAL